MAFAMVRDRSCGGEIARHYEQARLELVVALPTTATRKIQKNLIRADLAAELDDQPKARA